MTQNMLTQINKFLQQMVDKVIKPDMSAIAINQEIGWTISSVNNIRPILVEHGRIEKKWDGKRSFFAVVDPTPITLREVEVKRLTKQPKKLKPNRQPKKLLDKPIVLEQQPKTLTLTVSPELLLTILDSINIDQYKITIGIVERRM